MSDAGPCYGLRWGWIQMLSWLRCMTACMSGARAVGASHGECQACRATVLHSVPWANSTQKSTVILSVLGLESPPLALGGHSPSLFCFPHRRAPVSKWPVQIQAWPQCLRCDALFVFVLRGCCALLSCLMSVYQTHSLRVFCQQKVQL